MSVLLITRWYGGENNGVAILTETLAQALRAEGHQCVVLEILTDGLFPRRRIGRAGEIIWGVCLRPKPSVTTPHRLAGYALRNLLCRRLIRRLAREQRLTVAHFHYASATYDRIATTLRSVSVPWVATFHGSDLLLDVTDPACRTVMDDIVSDAAAVSAVSDALRQVAVRTFPRAAEKTVVVHNSVAVAIAEQAEHATGKDLDAPAILFLGNLYKRKGVDVLLRAWADLVHSDRAPDPWMLIVAGDGEEGAALKSLAADAGISDRVRFLGLTLRSDVPALLAAASIMVVPSRAEPFGLVAAEGQMFGRAVVASATGGLREIVQNDVSGLSVPPDDAAALAAALATMIADPELRRRLGSAAHDRAVREFSPRAMVHRYLALYGISSGV